MGKDLQKKNIASRKNQSEPRTSRGLRIFVWCVDLFMLLLVGVAIYVVIVFLQMPSLDAILHETRPATIIILDQDGNEIRASNGNRLSRLKTSVSLNMVRLNFARLHVQ